MPTDKDLQPIADLDRVVHSPARLMILAYLAAVDSADFIFLMNQVGLTRGNLSSHLNTLEEAGYVDIQKEFVDKVPRTLIRSDGCRPRSDPGLSRADADGHR